MSPDEIAANQQYLLNDKQEKVDFLQSHFSSIWRRFTFMLTIESALFYAVVQTNLATNQMTLIAFLGVGFSIAWYLFLVRDYDLVLQGRALIDEAAAEYRKFLDALRLGHAYILPVDFPSAGSTRRTSPMLVLTIVLPPYHLGTVRLAVFMPIFVLISWGCLLLFFV